MTDVSQIAQQITKFAELSALIIPVVIGLTSAVKLTGLPSKWSPLVAVFLGLAASFMLLGVSAITTFMGLIYGLSASGLYSGTKAVASETSPTEPPADQPSDPDPQPSA